MNKTEMFWQAQHTHKHMPTFHQFEVYLFDFLLFYVLQFNWDRLPFYHTVEVSLFPNIILESQGSLLKNMTFSNFLAESNWLFTRSMD